MNQVFDPLNLLILAVAVIVFFRLRSVLGTRTGSEKSVDPIAKPASVDGKTKGSDNVVRLPKRDPAQLDDRAEESDKPVWSGIAPAGSDIAKGLEAISATSPEFRPVEFISGARMAYEMIVNAFAAGDKNALKPLLSREVYDGFSAAIDERVKSGNSLNSRFVGITKSDIVGAALTGKRASLTVKFVSDLISATLDSEGRVIDGDPTGIQEITDVWTFERDTTSRDPNWRLVATEAV